MLRFLIIECLRTTSVFVINPAAAILKLKRRRVLLNLFLRILCPFTQDNFCSSITCHYPLFHFFSRSLSFFPFALFFPLHFLFHNPFALRLSNKSHLIVHFLSWPGAWCQTSCMKCSFTALPASTFVQRKNNKKSHRAS